MPTVRLPTGQRLNFPDGMSEQDMLTQTRKFVQENIPELGRPQPGAGTVPEQEDTSFFDFPSTEEVFKRSPTLRLKQTAVDAGVDPNNPAPIAARLVANLGVAGSGTPEELAEVTSSLRQIYGDDVNVRRGEQTGELEFKTSDDKSFRLFNQPGLDITDLGAATPEIAQIATEAVGSIAGVVGGGAAGPAGAAAGGVAAEAFTSFGTELLKGVIGRSQGLDISDDDLVASAMERAGTNALGAAAFPILGVIARRILGRIPKALRNAIPEEQLIEAGEQSKVVQKEFKDRFGETPSLSVGQETGNPAVIEAERALARRRVGKLGEQFEQQEDALRGAQKQVFPETEVSPLDVGQRVQAAAPTAQRRAIQAAEATTGQAEREALETAGKITARAETADVAGEQARNFLVEAKDAVEQPFREGFDEVSRLSGINVDLLPVRRVAQGLGGQLRRLSFKSLIKEDVPLIREGRKAGLVAKEGAKPVKQRLVLKGTRERPARLSDVQRDLSNLRDELRVMKATGVSPKRRRAVGELHKVLLRQRNKALKESGDPDLFRKVIELERGFARAKQDFERGIVGDLIRREKGGDFVLQEPRRIIQRLLNNPGEAQETAKILTNRSVDGSIAARRELRKGFLGEYERRVIDPDTGLAKPGAHNTFIRNHERTLDAFFNPQEITQIKAPGQAAKMLQKAEKSEQEIISNLESSFGFRLAKKFEPNTVVQSLFRPDRLGDFVKARRIIKKDPQLLADFDDVVNKLVFKDVSSFNTSSRQFEVDTQKLVNFLRSDKIPLVRESQGGQFIKDLELLAEEMTFVSRDALFNDRSIAQLIERETGLRSFARFLRVPFAPLTPRGRALTATVGVAREKANETLAEALGSPDRLRELMKLRRTTLRTAQAETVLGGLGAGILTAFPSE